MPKCHFSISTFPYNDLNMKTLKPVILLLLSLAIVSCGTPKYATITSKPDLSKYEYVYLVPTEALMYEFAGGPTTVVAVGGPITALVSAAVSAGVSAGASVGYKKTHNQKDLIENTFMAHGFEVVTDEELADKKVAEKTVVVNFVYAGRKMRALGYSQKFTIQLLDAVTSEEICAATGEGMGSSPAADVFKATKKCLDAIFN